MQLPTSHKVVLTFYKKLAHRILQPQDLITSTGVQNFIKKSLQYGSCLKGLLGYGTSVIQPLIDFPQDIQNIYEGYRGYIHSTFGRKFIYNILYRWWHGYITASKLRNVFVVRSSSVKNEVWLLRNEWFCTNWVTLHLLPSYQFQLLCCLLLRCHSGSITGMRKISSAHTTSVTIVHCTQFQLSLGLHNVSGKISVVSINFSTQWRVECGIAVVPTLNARGHGSDSQWSHI